MQYHITDDAKEHIIPLLKERFPWLLLGLGGEILVGLTFGLIFGIILGLFAKYWLGSDQIGFTVGVAMFINGTIAPIVALSVSELLFKERSDPALGAGPFTTVIQ